MMLNYSIKVWILLYDSHFDGIVLDFLAILSSSLCLTIYHICTLQWQPKLTPLHRQYSRTMYGLDWFPLVGSHFFASYAEHATLMGKVKAEAKM